MPLNRSAARELHRAASRAATPAVPSHFTTNAANDAAPGIYLN